jgi:putative phosphoribosyl transferase
MFFRDRVEAGRMLATALRGNTRENVVVIGLARGGVVCAAEVARAFGASLDIVTLCRVGHPLDPEIAVAAVAASGQTVMDVSRQIDVDQDWLQTRLEEKQAEARRRRELYLGSRAPIDLSGKTAILVDDGVATGLTMKLAILVARRHRAARVVVASPVGPPAVLDALRWSAEEVVTLGEPDFLLGSVGAYYDEFYPVPDTDVIRLLDYPYSRTEEQRATVAQR